jgi:hypothetical protein
VTHTHTHTHTHAHFHGACVWKGFDTSSFCFLSSTTCQPVSAKRLCLHVILPGSLSPRPPSYLLGPQACPPAGVQERHLFNLTIKFMVSNVEKSQTAPLTWHWIPSRLPSSLHVLSSSNNGHWEAKQPTPGWEGRVFSLELEFPSTEQIMPN